MSPNWSGTAGPGRIAGTLGTLHYSPPIRAKTMEEESTGADPSVPSVPDELGASDSERATTPASETGSGSLPTWRRHWPPPRLSPACSWASPWSATHCSGTRCPDFPPWPTANAASRNSTPSGLWTIGSVGHGECDPDTWSETDAHYSNRLACLKAVQARCGSRFAAKQKPCALLPTSAPSPTRTAQRRKIPA